MGFPWVFPARDAQESATPGKGSEKRCKDASRCHAQARGPGAVHGSSLGGIPKCVFSTGGYLFIYVYIYCIYILYIYIVYIYIMYNLINMDIYIYIYCIYNIINMDISGYIIKARVVPQ